MTPVSPPDPAVAPVTSNHQKSPELLNEEVPPAMPPMEVEVGVPCAHTPDCEAECWSDNGTENDSEWEEARDQRRRARTMNGVEARESGGFNQSGIDRGLYSVGGIAPRTVREKKLKARRELEAGKLTQRQYDDQLRELAFKEKQNNDLKRNTPTLATMFARKRPLAPTDSTAVEHVTKRIRLSEDDAAEPEEIELEEEESAEVITVPEDAPNDGPTEGSPIELPSDDDWSSESDDELESGRHAGRVNFKEMKREVKKHLQVETKAANMKAVRMFASLCDFYDKVESAGRMQAGVLASKMVGRGPSFARRVQAQARHFEHHGRLLPFNQGKRVGLNGLLSEEDVRMAVARWLRKLPAGAVKPKLLADYVNKSILPQFNLRKVSISTRQAERWLHFFGYQECRHKKGVYWDGHERPDVAADRPRYLEEIQVVQKLSREWIEVEGEIIEVLPQLPEGEKEHVILYHDECARHGNERSDRHWLKEGQQVLHRKDPGRLMMVSEFITGSTPSGRLVMSEEQINEQACLPESQRLPPNSRKIIFPTGKPGGDSYWNMDQMIAQIKETIRLGEYLLPNTTLVFVFDNSSAHNSRATDALHVNNMNVYPGGVASVMHDTIIPADNPHGKGDQPQVMQFTADLGFRHNHELRKGQPKGIAMILEERGFVRWVSTRKVVKTADGQKILGECDKCKKAKARKPRSQVSMLLDIEDDTDEAEWEDENEGGDDDDEGEPECCLHKMLARQSDFLNEKSLLYQTITTAGHKCIFLPKFHCELNPIEYYWAWVKRVFREKCDGNFANSKRFFAETLDACPGDVIRRFLRRADRYASVYRLGATGPLADYAVKKFRSHRSVTLTDLSLAEVEKKAKSDKNRKKNVH